MSKEDYSKLQDEVFRSDNEVSEETSSAENPESEHSGTSDVLVRLYLKAAALAKRRIKK